MKRRELAASLAEQRSMLSSKNFAAWLLGQPCYYLEQLCH